jgi:hypothetical protein
LNSHFKSGSSRTVPATCVEEDEFDTLHSRRFYLRNTDGLLPLY